MEGQGHPRTRRSIKSKESVKKERLSNRQQRGYRSGIGPADQGTQAVLNYLGFKLRSWGLFGFGYLSMTAL